VSGLFLPPRPEFGLSAADEEAEVAAAGVVGVGHVDVGRGGEDRFAIGRQDAGRHAVGLDAAFEEVRPRLASS